MLEGSKLALTMEDLTKLGCGSRAFIYKEIAAGRLKANKLGRRTVVLPQNLETWIGALPEREVRQ
jgi:hypothetical protein